MADCRAAPAAGDRIRFPGRAIHAAALTALVAQGCGHRDYRDSLQLAPVHGVVTCKGKPLTSGQVVFLAEKDTVGVITTGVIQPDGTYKMQTSEREGALIGWNRVLVRPYQQANQKPSGAPPTAIPDKYSWLNQSPLRTEVKSGQNEYNIVLE
jgi:hypothetical protein